MVFRLGKARLSVVGQTAMARRFAALLAPLAIDQADDGAADIEFAFANRAGDWSGPPPLALDEYRIAADRYRVIDKLWTFDVQSHGQQVRVALAPTPDAAVRRLGRSIVKSWRYLHTHGRGGYLHALKRAVFYVYLPVLGQVLPRFGSTFAHCAAVERDGRAVLLAATGGVGKTSILGKFLASGWRFLSDDMSILNADGSVAPHPLPMHIYRFHEKHSPELVQRMLAGLAGWDRALWRVLGWVKESDRVVRWISPRDVLGADALSPGGKIASAIHLVRDPAADAITERAMSPEELGDLVAGTLFHEIGTLPRASVQLGSCQPGSFVPTLGQLYASIRGVVASAVAGADRRAVTIPPAASIQDVYQFITKIV